MKNIHSSDYAVFAFNRKVVFSAVADVSVYEKWWSKNVKVEVIERTENFIGSKIKVNAFGGWFKCELISAIPDKEVRVKYYEGVQIGEGIWKLEDAGDGKTKLSYTISLVPNGFVPKLFSYILDYSKIHSKAMSEMFESLETYLGTNIENGN